MRPTASADHHRCSLGTLALRRKAAFPAARSEIYKDPVSPSYSSSVLPYALLLLLRERPLLRVPLFAISSPLPSPLLVTSIPAIDMADPDYISSDSESVIELTPRRTKRKRQGKNYSSLTTATAYYNHKDQQLLRRSPLFPALDVINHLAPLTGHTSSPSASV